jgi:Fic family protein
MMWNWQLPDWPGFIYDVSSVASLEQRFLQGAGGAFAVLKHLNAEQKRQFIVEILCAEGQNSAEIEGEILERKSLQSSIQRHFGLSVDEKKTLPKELGMANLMCNVYDTYDHPLTHEMLFEWHELLMHNEQKVSDKGKYRSHEDPMQIVSGRYDKQRVFFEAPPSKALQKEMSAFIEWFNASQEKKNVLARAALVHVYFESIHPFEDGNGRVGRALVEKALSQSLGQPTLIAVSQVITQRKKEYYAALGSCNRTLDVSQWMLFFSEVVVQSQENSLCLVNFLMAKSTLMNYLSGKINDRQEKVLIRVFAEGPNGFSGGLSAENYIAITKTSRATATRDLADLVEKGALYKTGQLKYTRYWLNIDMRESFHDSLLTHHPE